MALDPTARESNLKDSIKKHFLDKVESALKIPVMFDKGLTEPKVQGRVVDRWVSVNLGTLYIRRPLSSADITVKVCTKQDPEGYKLSQLRDKVLGTFFGAEGCVGVPLYQSHPSNPWAVLTYMTPYISWQSGLYEADDETKFKTLILNLKWGTII